MQALRPSRPAGRPSRRPGREQAAWPAGGCPAAPIRPGPALDRVRCLRPRPSPTPVRDPGGGPGRTGTRSSRPRTPGPPGRSVSAAPGWSGSGSGAVRRGRPGAGVAGGPGCVGGGSGCVAGGRCRAGGDRCRVVGGSGPAGGDPLRVAGDLPRVAGSRIGSAGPGFPGARAGPEGPPAARSTAPHERRTVRGTTRTRPSGARPSGAAVPGRGGRPRYPAARGAPTAPTRSATAFRRGAGGCGAELATRSRPPRSTQGGLSTECRIGGKSATSTDYPHSRDLGQGHRVLRGRAGSPRPRSPRPAGG